MGDISKIILPVVISLLIIWLIYRIKNGVRSAVKNEIYNNFPAIKDTITGFEQRLGYLKNRVEELEKKIGRLEGSAKT